MNRKIIRKIISHEAFIKKPPVLVDVGASGDIHSEWAEIAPYSVCLAFDGDDRELKVLESGNSGYKNLIVYHRVLTADSREHTLFYLTDSPYCSSLLKPDTESLKPYSFRDLFRVTEQKMLRAVSLPEVLKESKITYVDWFKTDSQGTDLRLFNSLPPEILRSVKIAEFEPGIIDAYTGEDKFGDLLCFMKGKPFLLDDLQLNGVYRIQPQTLQKLKHRDTVLRYMKKTPGWVNAFFLNTGEESNTWELRDILFLLLCCLIRKQYGMCYELSEIALQRFPHETLLGEIMYHSERSLDVGRGRDFYFRIRNRFRIIYNWWLTTNIF